MSSIFSKDHSLHVEFEILDARCIQCASEIFKTGRKQELTKEFRDVDYPSLTKAEGKVAV